MRAAPQGLGGEVAAIQGIEQATDPSAVVGAFASGFAISRNDPQLYSTYVQRMVEFGLPEMAYHQAQTLSTLQPDNGMAWGVIAYVDARRADMMGAVSAINLAGQFAPDNKFVQSTAGEVLAWYDHNGNKVQMPESARAGLAKIRALLQNDSAYTQAYNTATQAYEAQAQSGTQSAPAPPASPSSYTITGTAVPSYTPYYNDYYYAYGPGWIEPAPWWWWQPLGFWYGYNFVPIFPVVVFHNHEFFEHHHFEHGKFIGRGDHFEYHELPGHGQLLLHPGRNKTEAWHPIEHDRTGFFGRPANANPAVSRWSRENFQHGSLAAASAPRSPSAIRFNHSIVAPRVFHAPHYLPNSEMARRFPRSPLPGSNFHTTTPVRPMPFRTFPSAPGARDMARGAFSHNLRGEVFRTPAFHGSFRAPAAIRPAPFRAFSSPRFNRGPAPESFRGAYHGRFAGGGFHGSMGRR